MGDDPAPTSVWSAMSPGQCGLCGSVCYNQHDGSPHEHGRAKVSEVSTLMLVHNPQHQGAE
jgi:hypothetical protein